MKRRLGLLILLSAAWHLLPFSGQAQAASFRGGVVQQQCNGQGICTDVFTDKRLVPLTDPRFQPQILTNELQRAVTTGNPPGRPLQPPLPFNPMLTRPDAIPPAYPAGHNDGIRFLQ